jgi:Cu-Zn family superoxide dismutase
MKPFHALPLMTVALMLAGCATTGSEGEAASAASAKAPPPAGPMATALLKSAAGADDGKAEVVETSAGLQVTVWVKGLTPGEHGAHIHMTGDCTPPDFKTAGGHWNPTNHQHGKDNPAGMHMGDMPNITVGADGTGELQFTIPGGKLSSGDMPLLDADGAAVVIHAAPDDMKSDPAGNAGGRLACGVLTAS